MVLINLIKIGITVLFLNACGGGGGSSEETTITPQASTNHEQTIFHSVIPIPNEILQMPTNFTFTNETTISINVKDELSEITKTELTVLLSAEFI